MLPHPNTAYVLVNMQRQERLAVAARQRLAAAGPQEHAAGSTRRLLDVTTVLRLLLPAVTLHPRPRVWTQAT